VKAHLRFIKFKLRQAPLYAWVLHQFLGSGSLGGLNQALETSRLVSGLRNRRHNRRTSVETKEAIKLCNSGE
jgi:hypothetical protein